MDFTEHSVNHRILEARGLRNEIPEALVALGFFCRKSWGLVSR